MALQPRDRAKMKHTMATAKRQQPRLVDRTNKTLIGDLLGSGPGTERHGRSLVCCCVKGTGRPPGWPWAYCPVHD